MRSAANRYRKIWHLEPETLALLVHIVCRGGLIAPRTFGSNSEAACGELVAPGLLFGEVSNALWAMHRSGDIEAQDLRDAVAALRAAPVAVLSPMSQLAAAASELAAGLDDPV